jgi:predicted ABC-type ATPase
MVSGRAHISDGMRIHRPRCIVIAGPNGAGKSTLAPHLLGEALGVGRFVNVDTIASGLAGLAPSAAESAAGRLAIAAIDGYIAQRVDFAFETTLSGRRWPRLLDALERAGFEVALHYIWLPSPEMSLARVRQRVARGGHDVAEKAVFRRWRASVENLVRVWLARADECQVLESVEHGSRPVVATVIRGIVTAVATPAVWNRILEVGGDAPPRASAVGESYAHAYSLRHPKQGVEDMAEGLTPTPRFRDGEVSRGFATIEQIEDVHGRAVRRALAVHKALGLDTVVWRDGQVVHVPPEELPDLPPEDRGPVRYRLT